MASSQGEAKTPQEELVWVAMKESSFSDKASSKSWGGFLVPLGCVTTVGILGKGLHHMFKRDSPKQQRFMRYRVLAQGVTIAVAIAGILTAGK